MQETVKTPRIDASRCSVSMGGDNTCTNIYLWVDSSGMMAGEVDVPRLGYEEFFPQSRDELVSALASADTEKIRHALFSAAKFEPDWLWTQAQCLRFLDHADHMVRCAAAIALGYTAVYQRKLDLAEVLPKLHAAKQDALIASVVDDSLEMIHQYVKAN